MNLLAQLNRAGSVCSTWVKIRSVLGRDRLTHAAGGRPPLARRSDGRVSCREA